MHGGRQYNWGMGSAIFKTLTIIISSIYWYWLQKVFLFKISTSFLMALKLHSHESQAFPTIKNQENPSQQPTLSASDSVSPILAISLFCIIASVFLLASYFIFLTKWFHNLNQLSLLRRFSIMQTRYSNDSFVALTPTTLRCGLEESTIRDIPIQRFIREFEEKSMNGCVVCLSEFQEQDMLRVLPICSHGFHLDCIDIWLQTNSNCPLCRTSISGKTRAPAEAIMAPSSSPINPLLLSDNLMDDDEDFVVIELRGEDERERNDFMGETKRKRCRHVSIMGDEAIDVRGKDELFSVQPIRRSFSMDSAAGHELYSAVERTIIPEKSEASSSRFQRSCFAVRQGRGSRNAVLPLEF